MKKRYIILILLFFYAFNNCLSYSYINTTIEKIELNNLSFEFESKVKLSSVIATEEDTLLDTSTLGEQVYEDDTYIIRYTVEDKTPPLILGGNKSTTVGKKINLVNKFLCGDNLDDTPNCYVEGEYDINTVGTYKLTYVAISIITSPTFNPALSAGESLTIFVNTTPDNSKRTLTSLSTYIKKYKNKNTMIGIDVSAWQDDIDWKKAKADGVEFAMIRIGFGHTSKGELKLDNWYTNNIKKAKENKVKVGLYFYSYASSEEEAREQAKWIIKKLDGEKLDLPIAFDWEDWSSFNSYKVSFRTLTNIAYAFIDEVEKAGYKGIIYGSAYYLKNIWGDFDDRWVAYYTNNNDFSKKYSMWQITSSGKVKGIDYPVDINILYK